MPSTRCIDFPRAGKSELRPVPSKKYPVGTPPVRCGGRGREGGRREHPVTPGTRAHPPALHPGTNGGTSQRGLAAETAQCTRDGTAALGRCAPRCSRTPGGILAGAGENLRGYPPPLYEGIGAGVDPRVGRPSPTEVKAAAPRAVIPCSGLRRRQQRGQRKTECPWGGRRGTLPNESHLPPPSGRG
ncbi:hypothetical protein NDU88_003810 [Pleurodeles waltl]|uniref:Uncharacterized protein n=1 Tax=Pleurodeles waltl TaxID=8319 RepID=A0AAV7LGA5_PLEWA|nr:hypothetical protein NDU88_003810 [Pleurodeles waltl]